MNNNNIVKRMLSFILSLSMIVSLTNIVPIDAFADNVKSNIDMVCFGTGDDPSTEPVTELPNVSQMQVGDKIWIGAQFTNLTKIDENTNPNGYGSFFVKTGSETTASAGLTDLKTAYNYLSEYLKPVAKEDAAGSGNLSDNDNLSNDISENMASFDVWSSSTPYSALVEQATAPIAHESVEQTELDSSKNISTISVDMTSTRASGRIFQTELGDKLITSVVCFEVVKVPEQGIKLVELALNANQFTLETGTNGMRWGAQWNQDTTITPETNLKNYFTYGGAIPINPATYNVTFYNDSNLNSEVGTALTVSENGTVSSDDIPADTDFTPADGMYFKGLKYTTGASANPDTDSDFDSNVQITADTKVYAVYQNGYSITVHPNYTDEMTTADSTLSNDTKTLTVSPATGTKLTAGDEPKVNNTDTDAIKIPNGYIFDGWYTDAACTDGNKVVFDGTVTAADVQNLYAKWTKNWTITFVKVKGGTDPDNVVKTETMLPNADDKTVAKPDTDPTRTGYKFNGWYYDNADGQKTAFVPKGSAGATVMTGSTEIYGDWTQQFTVSYYDSKADATGDTNKISDETVDNGANVAHVPATSDKDDTHKYFIGWKNATDDTAFDPTTATVTSDLKLYRDWGDYHKVTFYKEETDITGGTAYDTKYVNPNAATTIDALPDAPTKTGYGFNKWLIYKDGAVSTDEFTSTTEVTGDVTVVADWTENITITLYPNDGQGSDNLGTKAEYQIAPNSTLGSAYTAPTRENYKLKEWNTKSNGSGTSYAADLSGVTFAASTTLYAIWEVADNVPQDQRVTLTFDSVGGTATNPASITVKKGDKIYQTQMPDDPTKMSATNKPYTFKGWFTEASLSNNTELTRPIDMDENKTAYAHWSYDQDDAITITFDDNGATTKVNPTEIKIAPGDSIGAAMPKDPEKTDNAFDGWYMPNASGTTKVDKDTTFNTATTVTAKWTESITVHYDGNGSTDSIADAKGLPSAAYANPTTEPTRNGYKFMGWNTKANGSGTFVTAGNAATYGALAALAQGDATTAPTEVTLYAYWAAVPDNTDKDKVPDNTVDPDPAKQGVKVTFDSNVAGNKTNVEVHDANPKYVYPTFGSSIGTLMPEEPTRTHYKFVSWNTKPDGSGVTVTSSTAIDTDTLHDDLKAIAGTNTAYETTLYAQWDIADDVADEDKVTVTFNKNLNFDGVDTTAKVITLYKGDSVGYDVAAPANNLCEFIEWNTNKDGVNGTTFDKTSAVTTDVTYYATWIQALRFDFIDNVATSEYTGSKIEPLYHVYQVKKDNVNEAVAGGLDLSLSASEFNNAFKATYTNGSVTELKNVGEYNVSISIPESSSYYGKGYKVCKAPSTYTVTAAKLTVKVDPNTQLQKSGATRADATVNVEGIKTGDVGDDVYSVKYYKWSGALDSGKIPDSALSETTDRSDVGKYIIKVELKGASNYVLDSVGSTDNSKSVLLYDGSSDTYPLYDSSTVAQNIAYTVSPSSAAASDIKVASVDKDNTATDATLKDTDYTTDKAFKPGQDETDTSYGVRVPKDTEKVKLTVTPDNADTTDIKATLDGTDYPATRNDDGTYTIEIPITKTGTDASEITVSMKNGDVVKDYTFNVQKLVDAKMVLNYGNSPYGEIMKDDTITDKDTAKADFDSTHKLTSLSTLTFYDEAWSSYLTFNDGLAYNGDKDDTSIFVYQRKAFRDPGVVLYDTLGNVINANDIYVDDATNADAPYAFSAQLTMKSYYGGVATYNDTTDQATDVTETANTTNHLFEGFKSSNIRPDIYKLNYKLTDRKTGEVIAEKTRFVIAISKLGDVRIDANDIVNNLDASAVKTNSTAIMRANSIYSFKIADAKCDDNKIVNNLDASQIKSQSTKLPQFYKELPSN